MSDRLAGAQKRAPAKIRTADYPFESRVFYERSAKRHWIEINELSIPEAAVELEVVAFCRVCENGKCRTLCSRQTKMALP